MIFGFIVFIWILYTGLYIHACREEKKNGKDVG